MVKRILFVCSGNVDRSPTAEALLGSREGFEVQSAGTLPSARKRVSKAILDWADFVFVMENHHKEFILSLDPEAENNITVLNIPDIFLRNDPELIEILKVKLSKYLNIVW